MNEQTEGDSRNLIVKNYSAPGLDVDLFSTFLNANQAAMCYDAIYSQYYKGLKGIGHSAMFFSDPGLKYVNGYDGSESQTRDWSECPLLEVLRDSVQCLTKNPVNFCLVQRYVNGKVGIAPHRDKEMTQRRVFGLSLGAEREIVFAPTDYAPNPNMDSVSIRLGSGSLYVMNPPTNSYWTHNVPKDPTCHNIRISLTFREGDPKEEQE